MTRITAFTCKMVFHMATEAKTIRVHHHEGDDAYRNMLQAIRALAATLTQQGYSPNDIVDTTLRGISIGQQRQLEERM